MWRDTVELDWQLLHAVMALILPCFSKELNVLCFTHIVAAYCLPGLSEPHPGKFTHFLGWQEHIVQDG